MRQSKEVGHAAKKGPMITGLSGGQRSVFLSTVYDPGKVMLVTASLSQAEKLSADFASLLPEVRHSFGKATVDASRRPRLLRLAGVDSKFCTKDVARARLFSHQHRLIRNYLLLDAYRLNFQLT